MTERGKHLYSLLSYTVVYLTVQRLFSSEVAQGRLLAGVACIGRAGSILRRCLPPCDYCVAGPHNLRALQ